MRNRRALKNALLQSIAEFERLNNRSKIPRKKFTPLKHKGGLTPVQLVQNFHARIPQYKAALKRNDCDTLRAAIALGIMKGMYIMEKHVQRTIASSRAGGRVTIKPF